MDDGHVTDWKFTTRLNQARSATAIATFNDRVYALGGMNNTHILNTVEMAEVDKTGELGHKIQ